MRQFDLYENPSSRSRPGYPYLVVVQSHLLDVMPTVVAAPLVRVPAERAYTGFSVRVEVGGETLFVSVAELAAVDVRELRRPAGDLREHEDDVRRALDRLFSGF